MDSLRSIFTPPIIICDKGSLGLNINHVHPGDQDESMGQADLSHSEPADLCSHKEQSLRRRGRKPGAQAWTDWGRSGSSLGLILLPHVGAFAERRLCVKMERPPLDVLIPFLVRNTGTVISPDILFASV